MGMYVGMAEEVQKLVNELKSKGKLDEILESREKHPAGQTRVIQASPKAKESERK